MNLLERLFHEKHTADGDRVEMEEVDTE